MFENAKWIAGEDLEQASPLFHKKFNVRKELQHAELSWCALGYGVCTLNGQPVTQDVLTTPITKYDATVLYVTYDVTSLLHCGINAVGCILGNGWYNDVANEWNFEKASWRHHPKLIFQLSCTYADGEEEVFLSDSSWKTTDGPCRYNHARCGEQWDARMEQDGWDTPEFDASAWGSAQICPPPGGVLRPAALPPIRVTKTIDAREIAPGVYDVGENISGWVRITVQGKAGTEALLDYGERLTENRQVDAVQSNKFCYEEWKHRDGYVLKGTGDEMWEPHFCYHGFRYVQIHTEAKVLKVEGRVVHTDLEIIGDFSCSDSILNQIHQATRRSTLYNYHSIPTDCPHREQNGWTGDALISAEQALMNYEMREAYRKWLQDFVDVQRPSGQLPGIVPTSSWGYNWGSGPAWDSALILIPYYVWRYTGDESLIKQYWKSMERYIAYMDSMSEGNLVEFGLGDWCSPDGTVRCPTKITDTAYYFSDMRAMGEMARMLGKPAELYEKKAEQIRSAFQEKFIKNEAILPESQTAYACAIYHGLVEGTQADIFAARLAELVRQNDYHIDCGILGTKCIFRALTDHGYAEVLYRMVTNPTSPSYAHWMLQGMTTLCEDWHMRESLNHHMFSEVDLWFYRALAGIQTDFADGRIVIAPYFLPQLTWVKARHGDIAVEWTQKEIHIQIPRDGTLYLDGKEIPLTAGRHTVQR